MNANLQIRGDYTRVASAEDIPHNRGVTVDANGIKITISNTRGEFYAPSSRYPRQNASLCKAGGEKVNAEHA